MLAGEGAITIWNGITPEGRAEFYAWHLHEHMAERVGIPGFRRGRRYIAVTPETGPEFFTLYETDTPQTLLGQDYANRLNAPTPWTQTAIKGFRDTARAFVLATTGSSPELDALKAQNEALMARLSALEAASTAPVKRGPGRPPKVQQAVDPQEVPHGIAV